MKHNSLHKILSFVLSICLVFTMIPMTVFGAELKFVDIQGHWAESDIGRAVDAGYVTGVNDSEFAPDTKITRVEFVTMINRALGLTEKAEAEEFSDVNEKDWYYDQILIALHAGYLSGFTDGTFKPDDSLTRAQASAIFSRIIPTYEMHSETGIQGFSDYSDFSWAADAIAVSYNKGYLKGYPDNSMRPNGTLTRAEALTVVLRILDNENIVNDDFTASTKETYKDTIYTGTIIVKSGEQVVFDNSVLLGTLESKTTEKATKWELKNDTRVVNTKYAASGGSSGGGGGGGGGGTTVQEVQLAKPAIHLVKSGDKYIVTGISSNEGTVVSEYKITAASESGEAAKIGQVKVDSSGNYSAEIPVAEGTSKLTITAQAVKARDTSSKKFLPSEVASKDYSAAPEVETVTASYETKIPTTDQYQTSVEWTLEENLTAADYAGGFEVQLYQVTTGGAQEVYTPYGSPVNVSSEEFSHIFDGSLPAGTYRAGVVSKGGSDPLSFDSASVLSEAFTVENKTPVEPSDPDNLSAPKLDVVESEDGSKVTLNIKNTQPDCGENCIGDYSITVKEKGSEGEPVTVSKEPFEEGDLTSFDITSYVQDAAEYEISVVLKAGTDQPSGHHHKDSDPAEITVTRLGDPENVSIDAVAGAEENIAVVSWAGGLFHEKAVEYVITLTETTIDGTGDAPQGDPKTVTVAADQITSSDGRYSCDVTDEITEMFGSESGMKSYRAEVQAMGDKKVILRSKSVKAGVTGSDVYHARMNVVAAPQATGLTFDLTTDTDKVFASWTQAAWTDAEGGVHPEENGYLLTVYKDGEKVADMPVSVDTGTVSYDISKYIDASEKGTYTFGLITKGYVTDNTSEEKILVFASNEAKSADSAAGGSIESGPVTAPKISFAEREGDSTSYPVYLTDPAGSKRPSDTARYRVTVTGTYQGATKEVDFETDQTSFDLTALNRDGTFAAPKPGDFMYRSETGNFYADNADYTVSAAAVPSNTALNTESEEVNKTDEFRLAELDNAALDPSITTVNGKTAVSWKEDVPGAAAYTVTVVLPNGKNFEGELEISGSQCDITEALKNGAGEYQVKVSAVPVDWSTVYKAGTSDLELTVLAAPKNVEIAAEEDTAKVTWSEVADADSYSVVIKKDGTVVGDPVEIVDVTEYDITETIKANGAGSYTAEVTAVGNGSQFITSAPGVSAPFVVRQLQDAEDVALTADKDSVDVSWTKVEDADGYRVDVYVEDTLAKSYDVESGDQTSAEISDAITDEHRKADTALTVRAEVTALGSLANGTLTSENSGKGTLAQKAGILPSPSVTNEDGKIVQEGGKLLVKYALDDNSGAGVGVDAIEELVLTLKYTVESAGKTVNIKLDKDIAASGAFDVTEHLEGANSYQATVKTVAKYSVLNAETETEATLEYQVKELPAPELKVTEDGNYLYWAPIELSDGKILDSGKSFTVEVKDAQDGSWKSVSDDDSVFGIAGEGSGMPAGSVYIDLSKSPISLNDGVQKWFRVTASNDVDATYGSESSAEITVKKLYAAEDVALTAAEGEDVVKASWTDDKNTAGQVAGYRVELLKKSDGDAEVVADETVVAADREYTFSAGAVDPAERAEYTVRVTVIGTHAAESAFYADSSDVTSDPALISGSVPSVDADSVRIYEDEGKLWLEIGFAKDSDYSKVDSVTLDSMSAGSTTVDTKALEGMLDEDADKVIFDLSGVQATILANIGESWTSHITVHSVNPALNADTEADVTAEIEVTQLDAPEIDVNQDPTDTKEYTISWNAVEGATKYEVTYKSGGASYPAVTVKSDEPLNFTVPNIESGKVYTITVTAKTDRPITLTDSTAEVSVSRLQEVDSIQINPENGMIQWKDSKNPAGAAAYNLYVMKSGTTGGKAYVSKAGTEEISLGAEDLYPDFNSQEEASYLVAIRPTAASAEAVDGVYYMKSAEQCRSDAMNAGRLPEVTGVTNVTPEGSNLYVSFTEPATDTLLYNHISGYTLKLYNEEDNLVYQRTQDQGTSKFDVTETTEGQPGNLAPGSYQAEITTNVADGFAGVSTSVTTKIEIEYAGRNTAENPVISVDTGNGQISWTPSEDVDYEASYSYDGDAGTVSGDLTIADGVISADQFGKIPAGVDYTVTITVSDPTGTMGSNAQTITLHKLSAVTGVTVTEQGTVTFTEAGDTSDGTVAVSVNGTEVSEQSGAYTWITDAIRDGNRADYSAAVQVKGSAADDVYYIDSEVSESAVSQRAGMVPEVTLGDAIESVDGKLVIRYSLPADDSNLIDESGLMLTLKQAGSQSKIAVAADKKYFDVTEFVQKNPGGYEAELTVPAANPVLNGERKQTKKFNFDKTPIAAPELTVDTAKGIISWTAEEGVASYIAVLTQGKTTTALTPAEKDGSRSVTLNLTPGMEYTLTVTAVPSDANLYSESSAEITVEKLKPAIDLKITGTTLQWNDENNGKTGEYQIALVNAGSGVDQYPKVTELSYDLKDLKNSDTEKTCSAFIRAKGQAVDKSHYYIDGERSEEFQFKVGKLSVPEFTLSEDAGRHLVTITPVAEAVEYQIFISKDGGNETTLKKSAADVDAGATVEIPSSYFDAPGTVNVSVQAIAAADSLRTSGDRSAAKQFTTEAEILEIENLTAKLDTDGKTVTLTWESLGDGVTYEVTGMNSSAITIDDDNASAKIDTAAVTSAAGVTVTVKAVSNSSLQTGVGGEASLTLSRLTAPVISSGDDKLVKWNKVADADHYSAALYLTGTDQPKESYDNLTDTEIDVTDDITETGTYAVKVRAHGADTTAGEGETLYLPSDTVSVDIVNTKLATPGIDSFALTNDGKYVVELDTLVDHYSEYRLSLYKDSEANPVEEAVWKYADGRSTEWDVTDVITKNGAGTYTVKVQAAGNSATTSPSEISEAELTLYSAEISIVPEAIETVLTIQNDAGLKIVKEAMRTEKFLLPAGSYSVNSKLQDTNVAYEIDVTRNFEVTDSGDNELTIAHTALCGVTFQVTPQGAKVDVYSDADRKYPVTNTARLAPGTYYYTVSKEGYVTEESSFEVADSDVTVTVDLTAAQTSFEKLTDALDNAQDGDTVELSAILPESEKEMTLENSVEIPSGVTLSVPDGYKLIVPDGETLTVNGTLKIENGGEAVAQSGGAIVNNAAHTITVETGGTLTLKSGSVFSNLSGNISADGTVNNDGATLDTLPAPSDVKAANGKVTWNYDESLHLAEFSVTVQKDGQALAGMPISVGAEAREAVFTSSGQGTYTAEVTAIAKSDQYVQDSAKASSTDSAVVIELGAPQVAVTYEDGAVYASFSKVTGFYDHDNNPDTPYITAEADRYEVLYQGSPVASLSEPGKVEIAGAAAGTYEVTVRAYGGENTVRAEGVGSLTLVDLPAVDADSFTVTDASGVNQTLLISGQTYTITAEKAGYYPASGTFTAGTDVNITPVYEAIPDPTVPVSVYVTDTEGNPLSGAQVDIAGGGISNGSGQTAYNGYFTLDDAVTAGAELTIAISSSGYETQNISCKADGSAVAVRLERTKFTPQIKVEDGNGAAVANAMVSLNGKVYYTDAAGMAEALPELETGRAYEVRAAKDGYNSQSGSVAQITDGTVVTLRLEEIPQPSPLSQVKFAVRDEDGNPVTGALVTIGAAASVTDASGIAVLEGDLDGDNVAYTVSATADTEETSGTIAKIEAGKTALETVSVPVKKYDITFSYYKYENGNYTTLADGDVIEKGSVLPKADLKNGSYTYLFGTNGCDDAMVTVVINGSDVAYNVVFTAKAVTP